jgi:fluoride exporter
VNALAMLFGGVVGVLVRLLLERLWPSQEDGLRWDALVFTVVGAFALGAIIGATLPVTPPGGLGGVTIGLSSALFTYCVFSTPALSLLRGRDGFRSAIAAVVHTLSGFGAAIPGVLLIAWLTNW